MASIRQWLSAIFPFLKGTPPPKVQRTPPSSGAASKAAATATTAPPRPSATPATSSPSRASPHSVQSSATEAKTSTRTTPEHGVQPASTHASAHRPPDTATPADTAPAVDTSVIEFEFTSAPKPPSLSREKREEIIRTEMRRLFRKSESDEITEALFKTVLQYRLEKSE